MAPTAIVSYDDTLNDLDALALARVLADAGTTLTLAYVRHTTETSRDRERLRRARPKRCSTAAPAGSATSASRSE